MGDILESEIVAIGALGDGVARGSDADIFVPLTAVGDKVKIRLGKKERFGYQSDLLEVLELSERRVKPVCQHFGVCGGCRMQHIAESDYADWMVETVRQTLLHHGHEDVAIDKPIISPPAARRRISLKALKTKDNVVLGFHKFGSHQIVALKECPVTRPEITRLFAPLKAILKEILPARMTAEVSLTLTASGVDVLIDAALEISLEVREKLVDFANTHDLATLNWQDRGFLDPIVHRREAIMTFGRARVPLPPAAFIQATEEGEKALVDLVLKATENRSLVADLFSGLGTFTFPLAEHSKVLAVEGFKPAVDAAQVGINATLGLKQIIQKHRDLYRRPLTPVELKGFDAVVFDPPRAGAKEQADMLKDSDVPTIVSVSCSPNSFGRDGRILKEGGYVLEGVTPVGQFTWTPHIELVGVYKKP